MKPEIWILVFQYPFQMCSKTACSTYGKLDTHSAVRTEKKITYRRAVPAAQVAGS